MHHHTIHKPVLLDAVLDVLRPKTGESYLDLTAGYGGHARAVLAVTKQPGSAVLVDRDAQALAALEDLAQAGARLVHADFASALEDKLAGQRFDLILMDLGVSSPHLDTAERGFSFNRDALLDMRMDQDQPLTAADVVNNWSKEQLTAVLVQYGEYGPNQAQALAAAIMAARPVATTSQLAAIAKPAGNRRIHPATRLFQAVRLAVNDELGQLERALPRALHALNPDGRLAVISFHSLEDRMVKTFLKEHSAGFEAELELITKKPIAGSTHDVHNPRARSAKLRAAVKINRKGAT